MQTIQELRRISSLFQRPQGIAWDGKLLWVSSMTDKQVYAMHPDTWKIRWQVAAPGTPFGITCVGDELRVLCGETPEDNRIIRRCLLESGFDQAFALPCPDDTGSQLGYDGTHLHVSQWYNKRVLRLSETGDVLATFSSPHEICGQVIVGDSLFLMTTDDESTQDFYLTQISLSTGAAKDLAHVPFQARGLAHDGECFWTNHREAHETVRFSIDA